MKTVDAIAEVGNVMSMAVVQPEVEEIVEYMMRTVELAPYVLQAQKDLVIAKQAMLIHSLTNPVDTEDKDGASLGEVAGGD